MSDDSQRLTSLLTRRNFIALGVGAFALPSCAAVRRSASFDAIVGHEGFASIGDALAAAPSGATHPHRILIRQGTWREKLTIDKPFIHLIGEDRKRSVVAYDAWSGQVSPNGERWGTRRSATLSIAATDCALYNLSVVNSSDYDGASANPPPSAARGYQAVALAINAGADRTVLEHVDLDGAQDTLFADAGRADVRESRIRGHVDFIFGAGTVWFDKCEIVARYRSTSERMGMLTAPSTLRSTPYGLVFHRCRLTKDPRVPAGSFALGRAWRPGTTFADGQYGNPEALGQAVFLDCWMDDHIDAKGWDRMAYAVKGGGTAYLEPSEARFFEHGNDGPGAIASASRRVLTDEEAKRFTRERVLAGWDPKRESS